MLPIKAKELLYALKNIKTFVNSIVNIFEYFIQKKQMYSFPQVVDIVITKNCNLDCCFCKKYKSNSRNMSLDDFQEISSQMLPYARKLNICSGGEPFLHNKLIDILRMAKKCNVWISVVSNGMLLTDNFANDIVGENLIDSLAFSVDGIKPKTVETIRRKAKFSTIIKNIEMLLEIKKKCKRKKPYLSIRYTLMRDNIEELPQAVSCWGNLGISKITCNYISLCDGVDKNQSLYFYPDITEKKFKEALEMKKEFPDMSLSLPPISNHDLKNSHKKQKKCIYPWMFSMIDVDGRIFPCYNSWGTIVTGNLLNGKENFKNIWNNPSHNELRRTANNDKKGKFYSYCSVCPVRTGIEAKSLHFGDEMLFGTLSPKEKKSFLLKTGRQI